MKVGVETHAVVAKPVVAAKPLTLGLYDCAALLLGLGLMGIAAFWPAARRQS